MPLNLASPGVVLKEVDVTIGRVDPTSDAVAAIVSPFEKGPVEEGFIIDNEQELLSYYGQPRQVDGHYESWFTGSSYLAYGGRLMVIRSDGDDLSNATVGVGTSAKINSQQDYINKGYNETAMSQIASAQNPGSWANGTNVAIIDGRADQIIGGITTTSVEVGFGVTMSLSGVVAVGSGTTSELDGVLRGVVTSIGTDTLDVKVLDYIADGGTAVVTDYEPSGVYRFKDSGTIEVRNNSDTSVVSTTYTSQSDWFDAQSITLGNTTISWNTLAPRPGTSRFASDRGARFDEVHVVVIDGTGSITGNRNTILEKHVSLSKASDAIYAAGSSSYWNKYISENSEYIFTGAEPRGVASMSDGASAGWVGLTSTTSIGLAENNSVEDGTAWNSPVVDGKLYRMLGNTTFKLGDGLNYDGKYDLGKAGALKGSISGLVSGYDLLTNTEIYNVDFLLMGSAAHTKEEAQSLASKLISVAEQRQDSVAFISPDKGSVLKNSGSKDYTPLSSAKMTDNVVAFYSSIPSSSYGVFDSGYKYMYDRFAKTFRYVPLNGDIAGICARNDVTNAAWVSPAGTSRGSILNAVKLAYNPSKTERDRLYSARINPVIFSPGSGIILFGDKTGLSKASAFDRINVRRLFIYVEDAIRAAADDQLFEFNDDITRSNFVNVVDPFLRNIQAQRGIQDYRVICDSTNNTAAIIDNNEFVADIYIKPSRSINFIGLTFVATRSGIEFNEVVGNI